MAGTTSRAAPRKAAATPRKATAGRAPAVPPELRDFYDRIGDDDEVSVDLVTEPDEEVETEKLFSIDGREYRIPVEFGPHLGLIYVDSAEKGMDIALGRVLKMAIGEDGWRALVGHKSLTAPQLRTILNRVMVKVMGALEAAAKN